MWFWGLKPRSDTCKANTFTFVLLSPKPLFLIQLNSNAYNGHLTAMATRRKDSSKWKRKVNEKIAKEKIALPR